MGNTEIKTITEAETGDVGSLKDTVARENYNLLSDKIGADVLKTEAKRLTTAVNELLAKIEQLDSDRALKEDLNSGLESVNTRIENVETTLETTYETTDGVDKKIAQAQLETGTSINTLVTKSEFNDYKTVSSPYFKETSWSEVSLENGIRHYSKYPLRWRVVGKQVEIRGEVTLIDSKAGSIITIGTIPEGYRPSQRVPAVVQCSGLNRALVFVNPNGTITAERIGTNAKIATTFTTWLTMSALYFV